MLDVRRWAEIRRMKEVEGLSIHEIVRRTGHDRNTVRRALRRVGPPRYGHWPRHEVVCMRPRRRACRGRDFPRAELRPQPRPAASRQKASRRALKSSGTSWKGW